MFGCRDWLYWLYGHFSPQEKGYDK